MNERMKKRNIERFDNEVGNGLGCNEEGIRDRLGIDKGAVKLEVPKMMAAEASLRVLGMFTRYFCFSSFNEEFSSGSPFKL